MYLQIAQKSNNRQKVHKAEKGDGFECQEDFFASTAGLRLETAQRKKPNETHQKERLGTELDWRISSQTKCAHSSRRIRTEIHHRRNDDAVGQCGANADEGRAGGQKQNRDPTVSVSCLLFYRKDLYLRLDLNWY